MAIVAVILTAKKTKVHALVIRNAPRLSEELEKLRQRIVDAGKEPTYGLHRKKQMPIFRMLKREIFGDAAVDDDGISSLVSLTQQLFDEVERELRLTGFWESIPARNKLKADLQRLFSKASLPSFLGSSQIVHVSSAA
jgi:hypothetical protein